jgi:hypothetical protein
MTTTKATAALSPETRKFVGMVRRLPRRQREFFTFGLQFLADGIGEIVSAAEREQRSIADRRHRSEGTNASSD